jgi:hypothetical protein
MFLFVMLKTLQCNSSCSQSDSWASLTVDKTLAHSVEKSRYSAAVNRSGSIDDSELHMDWR